MDVPWVHLVEDMCSGISTHVPPEDGTVHRAPLRMYPGSIVPVPVEISWGYAMHHPEDILPTGRAPSGYIPDMGCPLHHTDMVRGNIPTLCVYQYTEVLLQDIIACHDMPYPVVSPCG